MKTEMATFMDDREFEALIKEHFNQDYELAVAVEAVNGTNLVSRPGRYDWQWNDRDREQVRLFAAGKPNRADWSDLLEAMVRGGKLPMTTYVIDISW